MLLVVASGGVLVVVPSGGVLVVVLSPEVLPASTGAAAIVHVSDLLLLPGSKHVPGGGIRGEPGGGGAVVDVIDDILKCGSQSGGC